MNRVTSAPAWEVVHATARVRAAQRLFAAFVACLGVAVTAAAHAPPANAVINNFGGKFLDSDCCVLRGTRSGIQAPGSQFQLPNGTDGVVRVAAESHTLATGIIQIGFSMQNNASVDDCGSRSSLTHFWEYKVNLEGAPFHCGWIDGTPVVLGGTALYTVARSSSGVGVWHANLNGVQRLQVDVNFSSAHRIVASGELIREIAEPDGTIDACYACAGSNAWARTSVADPGSADWTEIQSATNINTDGQWSIDPLPGAWGIHHTL